MPELTESTMVQTDAETLWQTAGHFGDVGWHPMLSRVDAEGDLPGSLRTAYGRDGSQQIERLEAIDGRQHWYRYTMQAGAMPVSNYAAEFRVEDAGDRVSKVTWSARFDVNRGDEAEIIRSVRRFLRTGLDGLTRKYAADSA